MTPVMIHADRTVCLHRGAPKASINDDTGPMCAAGIPVTHVQFGGRVLGLDDAADLITEAFRPLADFVRQTIDAFKPAIEAWAQQNRPALEALAKAAQDPRVRAYIEARKRGEIPEPRPCHCLCGKTHPADKGICEAFSAVTTRRFGSPLTGLVDVPLCAPCAAAQGITELEAAR